MRRGKIIYWLKLVKNRLVLMSKLSFKKLADRQLLNLPPRRKLLLLNQNLRPKSSIHLLTRTDIN